MFNESRDFLRRWGSLEGERLGDAGSEVPLLGEVGGGLGSRGGGRVVCGAETGVVVVMGVVVAVVVVEAAVTIGVTAGAVVMAEAVVAAGAAVMAGAEVASGA